MIEEGGVFVGIESAKDDVFGEEDAQCIGQCLRRYRASEDVADVGFVDGAQEFLGGGLRHKQKGTGFVEGLSLVDGGE